MKIDAVTLMAFVDGELNAEDTAVVAAAIAQDAELAQRVDVERALRAQLDDAFAGQLNDPVPDRLLRTVREHAGSSKAAILNLQTARDARTKRAITRPAAPISRLSDGLAMSFDRAATNRSGSTDVAAAAPQLSMSSVIVCPWCANAR